MTMQSSPALDPLRRRLGIPDDARHVLVFTESSHWDPNWLQTSKAYFDRFVRTNLDQAIAALQAEPRRVYGVECMFFLRMYWERFPERRDAVRALVNAGRLRLTGSGVTTADTLLPSAEALLRDFLIGQEWLRANGMDQTPTLAYFTDSFGASPMLPSLLRASGFDRTTITRVDGMAFIGSDLESSKRFPRPGSSAERLLEKERSLDFVWRDDNGAEVLCHWNAYTYGQGDMLAYRGLSRVYLVRFAFPARSDRHVARRIRQYVEDLAPHSRTPYMLCPIGFDFVEPIPDLVELLDRYNRNHYADTGVWAVNAGLDDYMALIEPFRDALPVVVLDPNPYWTGFYAARPVLKARCRKLVDDLLLAEQLSLALDDDTGARGVSEALASAWWAAVTSNHHDFITGTSPDEVVEEEQLPWLGEAQVEVDAVLARLGGSEMARAATRDGDTIRDAGGPGAGHSASERGKCQAPMLSARSGTRGAGDLSWRITTGRLTVETAHYVAELDDTAGGTIVSLRLPGMEASLLGPGSNDLVTYRDSGGLWRMGYEFRGGTWRVASRASDTRTELQVREDAGVLEVTSLARSCGAMLMRRVWFDPASPVIRCRAEGIAPEGHTVTVRFVTGLPAQELAMDAPGGVVTRPLTRYYEPTFWPLQHFVHLRDPQSGRGLALMQRLPGAVSVQPDGSVEAVAFRNAQHEVAYGLIGLPACPAHGHEREPYGFDYAFLFTEAGDWQANGVAEAVHAMVSGGPWESAGRPELRRLAGSVVTTDTAGVWVTAVKPASRGEGVIVRLASSAVPTTPVTITANTLPVVRAFLCDARERDLAPLEVVDGTIRVEMHGTIATLRLLP